MIPGIVPAISDWCVSEWSKDRIRLATAFCPLWGRASWISETIDSLVNLKV